MVGMGRIGNGSGGGGGRDGGIDEEGSSYYVYPTIRIRIVVVKDTNASD